MRKNTFARNKMQYLFNEFIRKIRILKSQISNPKSIFLLRMIITKKLKSRIGTWTPSTSSSSTSISNNCGSKSSCILLIGFLKLYSKSLLLTLPAPWIWESCIKIKINLNFYFHTSFKCLKRLYEGLHKNLLNHHKELWKYKFKLIFFSWQERLNILR